MLRKCSISFGTSVRLKSLERSYSPRTTIRHSGVFVTRTLSGLSELTDELKELRKEITGLRADLREGLKGLKDPPDCLEKRPALEELKVDDGAVSRDAYEVAYLEGLAALRDGSSWLDERPAILKELDAEDEPDVESARDVAYYIKGREGRDFKLVEAAVDQLVNNVVEQDVGARKLMNIVRQRLETDAEPVPEVAGLLVRLKDVLFGRSLAALEKDEEAMKTFISITRATQFMVDVPSQPADILAAITRLEDILRTIEPMRLRKTWQELKPYLAALTKYYSYRVADDPRMLKLLVANEFVTFALPTALEPYILRTPAAVLDVNLRDQWLMIHDYIEDCGCEIWINVKSEATSAAVSTACWQLQRTLLFLEWAVKIVYGDSHRVSLIGQVVLLNGRPDKHLLPGFTRDSKISFRIVKMRA